jgi:hypothetical protein
MGKTTSSLGLAGSWEGGVTGERADSGVHSFVAFPKQRCGEACWHGGWHQWLLGAEAEWEKTKRGGPGQAVHGAQGGDTP